MTTATTKEMLDYYGYETVEEFGRRWGFYNNVDATRFLTELYEEDILLDEE